MSRQSYVLMCVNLKISYHKESINKSSQCKYLFQYIWGMPLYFKIETKRFWLSKSTNSIHTIFIFMLLVLILSPNVGIKFNWNKMYLKGYVKSVIILIISFSVTRSYLVYCVDCILIRKSRLCVIKWTSEFQSWSLIYKPSKSLFFFHSLEKKLFAGI